MGSPDWDDEVYGADEWDADITAEDAVELMVCSFCGAKIYEESEQCPACGQYVTENTHPFAGRPWWWIALGVLGIGAVILTLSWLLP